MNLALLLLSAKDSEAGAIVMRIAREAFPGVTIRAVETFQAVLTLPPSLETELIVLVNPAPAEAAQAGQALDADSLPRWAVVVLGNGAGMNGIAVPPEDWTPRALTRALHGALAQHALNRENARARGDMKTVSRRLTHDLRAQAGAIMTTTEAVRETMAESASALQLQAVIDATDGMMKLIDRISFVIRASSNRIPKQPLDMGMACWAALQRLETQILGKRATVMQPASWPEVKGVAPWLETVWWNLLANALQHGGSAPRVEVGWDQDGSELRFWLQDNGPGVPQERRGLLFHPFHLLHEPNAPNGLGLPIARRLIELQGGRCGYERIGDCSRFSFTLPAEPA